MQKPSFIFTSPILSKESVKLIEQRRDVFRKKHRQKFLDRKWLKNILVGGTK